MKFYVIYEWNAPRDTFAAEYNPPKAIQRKLDLTEGDEQYEYDYLGGWWEHGKHRKWVGLLTRREFEVLLDGTDREHGIGMFADTIETMGSLTEMGWLPAISFRSDADIIQSMYVTPVPQDPQGGEREQLTERDWERVRTAVINHYNVYR